MKKKFKEIVKGGNLFSSNDRVLIGVSGGVDSMVLLDLMINLSSDLKFEIGVAHLNHGVRGIEADGDMELVKDICMKHNVLFYTKTVDMEGYGKQNKLTPEEAGRVLRYCFFEDLKNKYKYNKLALAHNMNDQAETIMMRIMRGTGIDGIRGMTESHNNLIRPLISVSRTEIEEYAKTENVRYRTDSTNLETIYGRNKIRLELLPYIEKEFNPKISESLVRLSRVISEDLDYINQQVADIVERLVSEKDNCIIFSINDFKKIDIRLQNRVLRQCLKTIQENLTGIEEKHIILFKKFIFDSKTGKLHDIKNGIKAKCEYDKCVIGKFKENKTYYEYQLNELFELDNELFKIESEIINVENIKNYSKDLFVKCFDYDKISYALKIRNRRNGDKIRLLGMNGSKKLKDLFMDLKIPKDKRDNIPLLVTEDEIVWVIGYRISDNFKITNSTRKVLKIKILKQGEK